MFPDLHRPSRPESNCGPWPAYVEDLAALHPGDRPVRQPGAAPAAAARLVPDLLVRPGRLHQHRPLCPSCPPGLRPLRFRSDRGLGAGLASPSPDGGLEEFRRFCFSRGLKLSDPLPGLRQVHPRLLQRSHRLGQLPVQRCRQRGQHLIRRLFITGHTGTLRVGHAHRMHPPRSGVSPATGSDARLDEPGSEPGYRQASSPM